MQHFPRTLARLSTGGNPDFRLPTAAELAAMEAFMLAGDFPPGNDPNKFDLDRFALTAQQQSGRTAFFGAAKCSQCHGGDVLAVTTVDILGKGIGVNAAFNTGVVNEPINGAGIDNLPCEPSVGMCGTREFSTPQLFNVKNLAPFFHDASAATLAEAIDFYNSPRFNNSPAGVAIGGIAITAGTIADIQAFLEGLVGITGIVPATGDVGGGTAVTISGTNFVSGATVSIGGGGDQRGEGQHDHHHRHDTRPRRGAGRCRGHEPGRDAAHADRRLHIRRDLTDRLLDRAELGEHRGRNSRDDHGDQFRQRGDRVNRRGGHDGRDGSGDDEPGRNQRDDDHGRHRSARRRHGRRRRHEPGHADRHADERFRLSRDGGDRVHR